MEQAPGNAKLQMAPCKAALPAPDAEGYKLAAVHATVTASDVQNSWMSAQKKPAVTSADSGAAERASSTQGGARNGIEYGVRPEGAAGRKKQKGKKTKHTPCAH